MRRPLSLAAVLSMFALLAHAAPGCGGDDAECGSDADCKSATTACTIGKCDGSKCVAQPIAEGTRLADQSAVKDKPCVVLKCKAGLPTEMADGSKTGPDVACQKATCDGTTLKVTNIADGVPCEGGGACGGGKCLPPADAGPKPDTGAGDTGATDSGAGEAGTTDSGASGGDATGDATGD